MLTSAEQPLALRNCIFTKEGSEGIHPRFPVSRGMAGMSEMNDIILDIQQVTKEFPGVVVILIAKERLLPAISRLGDVMWQARDDDTS